VDYEKLKNETFQTNRGNEMYFKGCHLHHGLTITCDTATTKKGSWFMNYESQMNPELVRCLEGLIYERWKVKQRMREHPERMLYYQQELKRMKRDLPPLTFATSIMCKHIGNVPRHHRHVTARHSPRLMLHYSPRFRTCWDARHRATLHAWPCREGACLDVFTTRDNH
jgi:hypothetical protein